MTRALALGLVLSLSGSLACDDNPHCDVDLDTGDYDKKMCEAVDLVVGCLEDRWGDVADIDDDILEDEVDSCADEFDFCAVDIALQAVVRSRTAGEVRGDDNRCIG